MKALSKYSGVLGCFVNTTRPLWELWEYHGNAQVTRERILEERYFRTKGTLLLAIVNHCARCCAIVNKSSSLKRASRSHAKTGLFVGVLGSFFRFVFRACFGRVLLGAFSTFGWLWVVVWETF